MNILISTWLTRICGAEGGYVNNPRDPGGETKWGISKRSYPNLDIPSLTIDNASEIYKRDFIAPLTVCELPDSTIFQLLDFAVNSGQKHAVECLQSELGLLVDGIIGPKTQNKIRNTSESDLVMLITAARIDFMTSLKNWSEDGKGWMRRLAKNLRYGAADTE